MAHLAYEPGTQCYSKILETFGEDLKTENDGKIDRKKLGGKVFSSPESLHQLESIVWPEILKLSLEKTEALHQEGKTIIIWDAAVLLAAEWDKHVHEVNVYFLHCTVNIFGSKSGHLSNRMIGRFFLHFLQNICSM